MSKYERQLDFVDVESLSMPITVIGAGGIGSWTTLMLAKMGCSNISVIDFDEVEEHNVASQFFKEGQLGMKKVDALHDNVLEQTGIGIYKLYDTSNEDYITDGIVIIAVDSMEVRISLGQKFKDRNVLIIDGRMGGLQMEIYVRKSANYLETTCNPINADKESCTCKAISFNCATIGSLIADMVRLNANQKLYERDIVFDFENISLITDVPHQSQKNEDNKVQQEKQEVPD